MVNFNRSMLAVELFCYWYFLSTGFQPVLGIASHVLGTVACAWSMYNGIKWHYKVKDGEGLAWAVIGGMVFVGFSARWLIGVS
jgi:hypothetical protein